MSQYAPFPPGILAQGNSIPRLLRYMTYRSLILRDNPVSYWRLSKVDGTGTRDERGVNVGVYQGGYTLGQIGPLVGEPSASTLFNGTTGYSLLSTFTSIPVGGALRSIEAWFKYSGNGGTIFGYGDGSGGGQDFNLQVFNAGAWYLFSDGINNAVDNNNIPITGGVPTAGLWHHLVFSLISTTAYRAFLDGRPWQEGTFGTAINTATITEARIGGRVDFAGQQFEGYLAEVAVYSDVLLERRAYQHYRRGLGFFV